MATLTASTSVRAPIEKVWKSWITPEDIQVWNAASDDWYCPKAVNDFHIGGTFSYTMSARDGSESFDFSGKYMGITKYESIYYVLGDGRKVRVTFEESPEGVKVTELFGTEDTHSLEQQQEGWQAILDNFKKYVEGGF